MKVAVEGPTEFQGAIVETVMQRRGMIIGTTEDEGLLRASRPRCRSPRCSATRPTSAPRRQGKAEFTMEFARYAAAARTRSPRS